MEVKLYNQKIYQENDSILKKLKIYAEDLSKEVCKINSVYQSLANSRDSLKENQLKFVKKFGKKLQLCKKTLDDTDCREIRKLLVNVLLVSNNFILIR